MRVVRTLASLFDRRDVVILSAGFTLVGGALGVGVLPADWSLGARAAAGLLMGLNSALYVFGPRMVGGKDFD